MSAPLHERRLRVATLSAANEGTVLEYLSREPFVNVFITYLVLYDLSPATRARIQIAFDAERVCGVAYFGRQLAIACDPAAIGTLAAQARRYRGERMIIGERNEVRQFWRAVESWHAFPRAVRDRQLVMALDRERLRPIDSSVSVRRAGAGDWEAVAQSSAALIRQELDYDPRAAGSDFASNVKQMIERELWWVGEADGRLCFFCNIGPWCRQTAQLQGIWTPPDLRGNGLATAALSAICDRLFEYSPTVSLYVNDFNHAAIELYRRVGFEHVADFQTILF